MRHVGAKKAAVEKIIQITDEMANAEEQAGASPKRIVPQIADDDENRSIDPVMGRGKRP